MKKHVLFVIPLLLAAYGAAATKSKSINFANKAKSYDISVMSGDGKYATARMDASVQNPRTKRYVYKSKPLRVKFEEIKGGEKLKGIIALQAYDADSGALSHDEPKYYSIEIIKDIQETPTIQLDYGLFGYSFDADPKLHLKTKKVAKPESMVELGS